MSTTAMARSPFSTAAFAHLVRRLRNTNARYSQIARQFRSRVRPTHHARRRAHRAGLSIDTSMARACPLKYISIDPLPVLEISAGRADTPEGTVKDDHDRGDAYMRGLPLKNLPQLTVRKFCRPDGRECITFRLPSFKLSLGVDHACDAPSQATIPGAPRLKPRQLPEEEDVVEEMVFGSSASSLYSDDSDSLLTPLDVRVYTGLCITVPPRGFKRKLQDVDADGNFEQPKRVLKARWNESQAQ